MEEFIIKVISKQPVKNTIFYEDIHYLKSEVMDADILIVIDDDIEFIKSFDDIAYFKIAVFSGFSNVDELPNFAILKKEMVYEFVTFLQNTLNNKDILNIDFADLKRVLSNKCEFKYFKSIEEFKNLKNEYLKQFNKFLIEVVVDENLFDEVDECIEEVFGDILDDENVDFIQGQRVSDSFEINLIMSKI